MIKNWDGVAVANAVDKVKKIAKYVCENENGEGVCKGLEKLV